MSDWSNLKGLIPVLCGIYGLLLAVGILPRRPRDPERTELWRRKFGGTMMVLCPIIIVYGIAQLLGWMR